MIGRLGGVFGVAYFLLGMSKRKRVSDRPDEVAPPVVPKQKRGANWRVQMCRNYLAGNECPWREGCNFAHGESEQRTREENFRDGICTPEERDIENSKLFRYYGKPDQIVLACTTLSDWECLQQGLALLRAHSGGITEANLRQLAPHVLSGDFGLAEKLVADGMIPDDKNNASGGKVNLGACMKDILAAQKDLGTKRFKYARDVFESSRMGARIKRRLCCFLIHRALALGTVGDANPYVEFLLSTSTGPAAIDGLCVALPAPVLEKVQVCCSARAVNQQLPKTASELCMPISKMMQVMYEAAIRGNQRGAKHGALLFDRHGVLVSVGWNHKYSVSTKHSAHKVIHAEVHALAQLKDTEQARGGTMYIMELDSTHSAFRDATPCKMCIPALSKFGIVRAWHTTDYGMLNEYVVPSWADEDARAVIAPYGTASYDLACEHANFEDGSDLLQGAVAELGPKVRAE